MGPSNSSYLSNIAIFHDYGRKGIKIWNKSGILDGSWLFQPKVLLAKCHFFCGGYRPSIQAENGWECANGYVGKAEVFCLPSGGHHAMGTAGFTTRCAQVEGGWLQDSTVFVSTMGRLHKYIYREHAPKRGWIGDWFVRDAAAGTGIRSCQKFHHSQCHSLSYHRIKICVLQPC